MAPNTAHAGNDYYVNIVSHAIQQQSNSILGQGMLAAGYIGPYDWQTAKGVAAGLAYESRTTPSGTNPLTTVQQAAHNPLTGLNAIGDFFNRLTSKNTWIRIVEFGIGGVLLAVGLSHAFPQASQSVTNTARRAAGLTPVGRTAGAIGKAARSV